MASEGELEFTWKNLFNLITLEEEGKTDPVYLTVSERAQMQNICMTLLCDSNFNFLLENIQRQLCKLPQLHFPLEYFWTLHLFRILPLDLYLLELSKQPKFLSKFSKSVTALYCSDKCEDDETAFVISGLMSYLINKAFITDCDKSENSNKLNEVCLHVLNIVLDGFLTFVKTSDTERSLPFLLLLNCGILEASALQMFYQLSLRKFMELKPIVTITDAFKFLQIEKSKSISPTLKSSMKFIGALDELKIANTLRKAVKSDESNWESVLTVVSVLQTVQDGSDLVNTIVKEMFTEAFQDNNEKYLLVAFLIGRFTVQQEPCSPDAYRVWFQKNFCDSNSWAKNPRSFCLLMKALSNLVPIECAENLKVPLETEPFIPSECRVLFQKYASLSRVRIKDLKPAAHPETVLEKVLLSFQHTKKIPLSILEASLLQKQQFNNEFLKILMAPRKLPSVPDTKMKFINALKKEGKIPPAVFQQYEEACQKLES